MNRTSPERGLEPVNQKSKTQKWLWNLSFWFWISLLKKHWFYWEWTKWDLQPRWKLKLFEQQSSRPRKRNSHRSMKFLSVGVPFPWSKFSEFCSRFDSLSALNGQSRSLPRRKSRRLPRSAFRQRGRYHRLAAGSCLWRQVFPQSQMLLLRSSFWPGASPYPLELLLHHIQ